MNTYILHRKDGYSLGRILDHPRNLFTTFGCLSQIWLSPRVLDESTAHHPVLHTWCHLFDLRPVERSTYGASGYSLNSPGSSTSFIDKFLALSVNDFIACPPILDTMTTKTLRIRFNEDEPENSTLSRNVQLSEAFKTLALVRKTILLVEDTTLLFAALLEYRFAELKVLQLQVGLGQVTFKISTEEEISHFYFISRIFEQFLDYLMLEFKLTNLHALKREAWGRKITDVEYNCAVVILCIIQICEIYEVKICGGPITGEQANTYIKRTTFLLKALQKAIVCEKRSIISQERLPDKRIHHSRFEGFSLLPTVEYVERGTPEESWKIQRMKCPGTLPETFSVEHVSLHFLNLYEKRKQKCRKKKPARKALLH